MRGDHLLIFGMLMAIRADTDKSKGWRIVWGVMSLVLFAMSAAENYRELTGR